MRTNLANRVRELRYTKGWGPDDLAERAKISRTALYHLETGRTGRPQAATLRRLARALGVTPEELLREGEGTGRAAKGAMGGSAESAFPQPGLRIDDMLQLVSGSPLGKSFDPSTVSDMMPEGVSQDAARRSVEKFLVLLSSPMAGGLIKLVDDSFRLLPMISAMVPRAEPVAPEPAVVDEVELKPRRRSSKAAQRAED